ncbi:MAG: class I SAM-dependent methyltransferase [Deltaproteobacteria bacterium]|nr:class I SAM-dependent methyltransferase [Deltaproteobacteria bacterium]
MHATAVAVLASDAAARAAGEPLGVPVVAAPAEALVLLVSTPKGLALQVTGADAPGPVVVELVKGKVGWRKRHGASPRDPLCRALGLHKGTRTVVDATAGLLVDSMALVNAGLEVTAVERAPVVHALQRDAVKRAGGVPGLTLVLGDAIELLRAWQGSARAPDAVLVDPMYDDERSSVAPKEMRALRLAVGADVDGAALVTAARACARSRVVVKRSRHAPPLVPAPSYAHEGRTTRFDVYLRA